jgi:hypothetical protein
MASPGLKEILQRAQTGDADFVPNVVFTVSHVGARLLKDVDRGTRTLDAHSFIFRAMRNKKRLPLQWTPWDQLF